MLAVECLNYKMPLHTHELSIIFLLSISLNTQTVETKGEVEKHADLIIQKLDRTNENEWAVTE